MDASKVWQWRIMRVKTYLRRPNPFYHSNSIGLDFNVASNTQKKLDIQLVTNGVILEICDFARKVNKSRRHFITEILENNFDLASENEQQRIDFNARIVHKVNDLIKKPPKDKNEVFTLFDTSCTPECNNGLNMASTKRKTKGFLVEMDDTDDSENEDTFQCSQATSKEHIKTESPLVEIEEVHVVDRQHEDELKGSETQSAEARREAVLPLLFPCCEEIGLSLDVGSKQSLDPGLLTKGVMLELVHFTRILTASYSPIVLGVLEHNFELDVSSRQAKSRVWFKISHLLKRRKRFLTTGSKMTPEFKNERFSFQTNPFKRTTGSPLSNVEGPQYQLKEVTKRRQSDLKSKQEKTALSTTGERGNKRCRREQSKEMETNTLSPNTMYTGQITKEDHCYTCPLGESDLDSDTGNKCDMEQEEMRAEINYTCPLGESDLDSDTGNTCDMEQEEMGTENNMWKLRANCVKQILSSLNKELGPSKEFCIEFNVGFGPKQNISIDSLPNYLLEVAKFALAMNSSRQDFITEILEYNFDICLQSKWQKNIFTSEILNRVRKLRRCEGAVKISKEVSELPGPMPSINMMNHTVDSVKHELSRILRMEGCDVAPVCPPHSHAETTEHISAKSVDHYPFCEEIGLKLHVNKHQQNKKLDIDKLTNGAMNEVTNFAEKLCGTFEQICLDILGHNFNLDLKSGDSDLARSIVGQIYAVLVQQNLATCASKGVKITGKEFSTMIKLDCQNNPNSDICDVGSSQAAIIDQDVGSSADTKHQNELNLKLWRFRANRIEQILSVPHKEHCPLYSYTRCKKLGINFNVGSGEKQKLDPKSLTNGIMVELNTFATALSCQKHVITEILDYNFHLDFGNEVYRSAFAQQIRDKVEASHANKKYSIPRMKMLLNLLDMTCIQERKTHCLKCYQDRSHKLCQEEADPGHMHHLRPHTMADTVSADSNCTAPKPAKHPSSNFSGAEKTIMHSYPRCKKIGLNLCMDKDQPKDKLDTHVLTHRIMNEVASFAEILCGTKNKIINDIIEHNFNICMQGRELNPSLSFQKVAAQSDCSPAWLSEVYVIQRYSHKQPGYLGTVKREAAMQRSEGVETIKKRKLALQTKKERATLSRHKISVVKSKKNPQSKGNCLPICTDIGLDLDMTSKTGEKEKLDLKLLTRAVCDMEQEEMGTVNYYTCPPDSDKFSNSGDTGIQDNFQNTKSCSLSSVIPRESESTCLDIRAPFLTTNDISPSLPNVNPPLENQPGERVLCGGEEQTQTPSNALNECEMEEEEMGTEDMWRLRATRLKQILSAKELGPFNRSKLFGLEFNVGFGSKRNIPVSTLPNTTLLEIARFALAMNSSQQNFIMEILEYNFDFCLYSEYQRNIFTCELMNSVSQLNDCEDAVKFSNEDFELPGLPGMVSVKRELSRTLRMEECDVAPVCHSHAETTEHISAKSVDRYPFCEEIGLKLHVNKHQQNKKLDIDKLTNGAMTEVTNFAEKLCGTFEQICLDILGHNFDLDLQSGDSDLARSIVAQIPAVMAQINLVTCAQVGKGVKITGKEFSTMIKLDCQKNPNSDICDVGSSQAAIIDQDVGSSADTKHQNELNLKLWCFRANYIQEILSVPHEEHCPLYSYTRCKKLGINFNVGSGVKQKLDPKSLTNGIMVELNTFATALSSQKHVITEILDYNFHLDFDNEVYRSAFAQQMMDKVRVSHAKKRYRVPRMKMRFKLPDIKCIQQLAYMDKTAYCPKCYQDRSQKLRQDYSDPGHMHHPRLHTMVDTVSADANCTARKPAKDPSSSFSAIEKTIMDSYPGCKKIGLSLFVDKDQPKHKLDTCVLSHEIMWEVASFAKTFCGTKCKIIHEVLEHNFNLGMQRSDIAQLFRKAASLKDGGLTWFSEVFVISPISHRPLGYVGKVAREAAKQSVWKESIKNRKLALQMKKQRATLPSDNINVVKESETNHDCKVMKRAYPLCTEMGLDLDVTSKTGEKEKLELKLLTRAVVWEMHTFARKKPGKFLPHMVYDILDYNFDLSSQNHRCWEFSKATTSKIQSMIRGYHKLPHKVDKVFKLPFDFVSKSSQRIAKEMQNKKCTTNEGHFVRQVKYRSGVNRVYFLDGYKTKGACFHDEDTPFPTDPGTMVQMDGNQVNVGCGSHFQGNLQIKEEYDPSNGNVKPEPDTEEKHCVDYKTKKEACFHGEDTPFPTDPVTIVQMDGNEVNVGCGSPFQGNLQIKEEEYDPSNGNVKPEPDTEEKYSPLHDDVETESNTEEFVYIVPVDTAAFHEYLW